MRIHTIARANNVRSSTLIYVLNLVGIEVKSASSKVELGYDQLRFMLSVVALSRAIEARDNQINLN